MSAFGELPRRLASGQAALASPATAGAPGAAAPLAGAAFGIQIVEATVADESGVLKAVWFNQPWLVDKLPSVNQSRMGPHSWVPPMGTGA